MEEMRRMELKKKELGKRDGKKEKRNREGSGEKKN